MRGVYHRAVPQPLFNSVPPRLADFRTRVDTYIARWRQDLKSLEAGDMGVGPEGPVTAALVTLHNRIIATYEAIREEFQDNG